MESLPRLLIINEDDFNKRFTQYFYNPPKPREYPVIIVYLSQEAMDYYEYIYPGDFTEA